jgi:hypothetical protein
MMKFRLFPTILAALALTATMAPAQQLAVTDAAPKLDGAVSAKEYSLQVPVGKITLSAARTTDTVFLAVSAPTAGWVSVGFGSERMDKARLFLGYLSGGKPSFSQQLGAGHAHGSLSPELAVREALGEAGGLTTLEIALKASDLIPNGQKELLVLVAYGANDSFSGYHVARGSVRIQL